MAKPIKTEIVTITTEKAKELLKGNTHNRGVSSTNLAALKNSLQRGEWALNGEAIKIAEDGTILDGQHRLMACAETGIAFKTIIVWNVPKEFQHTMDTGKVRTHSDVLELAGYKNTVALAASTLAIVRSEQYGLRAAISSGSAYPITREQVLNRVVAEPEMIEVAKFGKKFSKVGLTGRIASLMFYTLSAIDAEDAQFFFEKLHTGESLERGNPILTLRNHLLALKENQRGTMNANYIVAILIKAWNKFRAGEECKQLKFVIGGANPDKFPEAI